MRFRILGPLEVAGDPDPASAGLHTPGPAKIRVVLGTLLARPNQVVSAEALIDELWPESPPRTALQTLHVYVSQVRKCLMAASPRHGQDTLVTQRPGYLLRVASDELDLTLFERLHEQGRAAVQAGAYDRAADLLAEAQDLWRGPLLSDTPHGPILQTAAARLHEARPAALELRIGADLRLGRHRELVAELSALVTEHPLREELHAQLMTALYRSERLPEALRAYARVRRTLVEELGVEPGPRLRALHRQLLAADTAPTPALGPWADSGPAGGHAAAPWTHAGQTVPGAANRTPTHGGSADFAARGGPAAARPASHAPADGRAFAASTYVGQAGGGVAAPGTGDGASVAARSVGEGAVGGGLGSGTSVPGGRGADGSAAPAPAHRTGSTGATVPPGHGGSVPLGLTAWLPAEDPVLVGRSGELARLTELLRGATAGSWAAVTGQPGSGKTALAVAAARRAADAYPDGVLFLDLCPEPAEPAESAESAGAARPAVGLTPAEASRRLLRQAGVSPAEGDPLDALRALTATRRLLLVLDNARSVAQVRALLPVTAGSTAVVTGPLLPAGSAGMRTIRLGHVGHAAAREILAGAGPAADEIARLCGRLPLALRAAALLLSSRPHWTGETLARTLRPERTRLTSLGIGELDVRESLLRTYRALPEDERRTVRLLGALPPGVFGLRPAAAALGLPSRRAASAVESVTDRGLLLPLGEDAYAFPELLRLLAVDRLRADESRESANEATARVCGAYAGLLADPAAAPASAQELSALTDLVRRAHAATLWRPAVELADALAGPLERAVSWENWEAAHTLALDAARRAGDRGAEARMVRSLGDLCWQQRRTEEAEEHYREALRLAERARTAEEAARALAGLAELRLEHGRTAEADALVGDALARPEPGPGLGRYEAYRVQAQVRLRSGDAAGAAVPLGKCLAIATELRDSRREEHVRRVLRAAGGDTDAHEVRPGIWRLPMREPASATGMRS
ncbi:BTAD domain-containing putative transcriptional regulator [Streptomyces sp. NPDC059072]|uniref:AfsR/SARP family transcriptional regulator n=1 Tax=Streptomyces sp. NPDC059072 TaxID=3346715 RepID=UPI0036B3B34A